MTAQIDAAMHLLVSMPGMMDTVLNIDLNETRLKGLIDSTGNERFAWDSYRRFVQMYGDVVLDLKPTSIGPNNCPNSGF